MTKEEKAWELVKKFHAEQPYIGVGLAKQGAGYVLVLDYGFTNLDADQQKRGREELNTLLTALQGIGLPVHLELGYV